MKKVTTKNVAVFIFSAVFMCAASPGESFHFTVTSDPHGYHATFSNVCQSINDLAGGPGAFHVSVGDDVDKIWENRAIIDTYFGTSAIWYSVIGNHEAQSGVEMEWLRNEYDNGNNLRTPLKNYTNQDGPTGTVRTNYSWDYGNVHFIVLNVYWNGGTNEGSGRSTSGSDTATNGDIVPALYNWLATDLASCSKPFIFIFGHEPAFPYYRHVGDSLDAHKANRDAFWDLLEREGVTAYISGHTHYYSAHQGDANMVGRVWQLNDGNAGNDKVGDGQTFFDIIVDGYNAILNVYRNENTSTFTKKASLEFTPRICIGTFDPKKYTPGESVLVSLAVKPDASIGAYAIEEILPSGWTASNINNDGTWDDVNKMVGWGPFADNSQRTFTYNALPSEGASCSQCFTCNIIVDDADITYQRCIESAISPEICKFGTFGNYKNAPLSITDGNGTVVTLNLTGGGWGETADDEFSRITLHNTTDKSVFSVKTKGAYGASIGDINVEGPIKGISAKTTDISGSIEIGPSSKPTAGITIVFDEASELSINSQMPIKSISATEWLGGSINAPSVGGISIKGDTKRGISGDLFDVNLILSRQPDEKVKMFALGKLNVKGWIADSQILSTGHIGMVAAGAILDSNCFAGVANGILGLPNPVTDINYDEPSTIKSIAIKGIKNQSPCVINSNFAAAQILSAYLAYPENNNGGIPFGVSAGFIKSLKVKDAQGTESWNNLDNPGDFKDFNDFEIRLY